jgi:hypothetical protein
MGMPTNFAERDGAKVVEVAQAMLDGALALVHKDRQVEAAERLYRDGAFEGCRKLIARFGRPTNPPL